jgi:hypothetical protein
MVIQIAAAAILPIVMLVVASSPFDEPLKVEPSVESTPDNLDGMYVVFFLVWGIWLLILTRVVYQVRKGTFRLKKGF